eukprot:scaffold99334_cov56-Attheya_sp.AAC.3
MVNHRPAAACHEETQEVQADSSEEEESRAVIQPQSQQDHDAIHQEDDFRIEPQTGRNNAIIQHNTIEEGENTRIRKAARREPQDEGCTGSGTASAFATRNIGDSETATTCSDILYPPPKERDLLRDVVTQVLPLHGDAHSSRPCLDIETALSVILPDHSSTIRSSNNHHNNQADHDKEWLSNDSAEDPKRDYLRFRVGHAGDAAALATFYNTATTAAVKTDVEEDTDTTTPAAAATAANETTEEEAQASLLELRLADGFGDEQRPPAFYAILTHVCRDIMVDNNNDTSKTAIDETTRIVEKELRGAAVVTLEWCSSQQERVLNVEFFHVAASHEYSELIQRRLLLRLSALALATHCASLRLPPNMNHYFDLNKRANANNMAKIA